MLLSELFNCGSLTGSGTQIIFLVWRMNGQEEDERKDKGGEEERKKREGQKDSSKEEGSQ